MKSDYKLYYYGKIKDNSEECFRVLILHYTVVLSFALLYLFIYQNQSLLTKVFSVMIFLGGLQLVSHLYICEINPNK